MARAYQTSKRLEVLTFSHHYLCRALQEPERTQTLEWCVREGISLVKLKAELKARRARAAYEKAVQEAEERKRKLEESMVVEGAQRTVEVPHVGVLETGMGGDYSRPPTEAEARQHAEELGIDLTADEPKYTDDDMRVAVADARKDERVLLLADEDEKVRYKNFVKRQVKQLFSFFIFLPVPPYICQIPFAVQ